MRIDSLENEVYIKIIRFDLDHSPQEIASQRLEIANVFEHSRNSIFTSFKCQIEFQLRHTLVDYSVYDRVGLLDEKKHLQQAHNCRLKRMRKELEISSDDCCVHFYQTKLENLLQWGHFIDYSLINVNSNVEIQPKLGVVSNLFSLHIESRILVKSSIYLMRKIIKKNQPVIFNNNCLDYKSWFQSIQQYYQKSGLD